MLLLLLQCLRVKVKVGQLVITSHTHAHTAPHNKLAMNSPPVWHSNDATELPKPAAAEKLTLTRVSIAPVEAQTQRASAHIHMHT